MQKSVSENREKYIGGSDVPIIMGLSPFKDRFTLLLEKAGLKEIEKVDNVYVNYGNIMEPKIRDYINKTYNKNFVEGKHIEGDIRCHTDGEIEDEILEIKTTSQVYSKLEDYNVYLVQLLFYMMNTGKKKGLLAVYERPDDFNEEFDESRLQLFPTTIEIWQDLIIRINEEVTKFRIDLKKLKDNPFLAEEDLIETNVVELANKVIKLENELQKYDELKKKYESFKEQLKKAMEQNNIKKWETPNGTLITLVQDTPDKEIEEEYYDEDKFIHENPELHERYHLKLAEYKETRKVLKKGRKGYVKITIKKE